jgi:hypothetical protein
MEVPYLRQAVDYTTPVRYAYGPDSHRRPGVPQGPVTLTSRHATLVVRLYR